MVLLKKTFCRDCMASAVKKGHAKSKAEPRPSSGGKAPEHGKHTPRLGIIDGPSGDTRLKSGVHSCSLYESEAEHQAQVVAFINDGFRKGEKVVYAVDAEIPDRVLGYFSQQGRGVGPFVKSGQLEIHSTSSIYAPSGAFDNAHMIARLKILLDHTLKEGYTGLRATGEMSWALRGWPGSDRLLEYEIKLNSLIAGSKCLALCQYHVPAFKASLLRNIRASHSVVLEKGTA